MSEASDAMIKAEFSLVIVCASSARLMLSNVHEICSSRTISLALCSPTSSAQRIAWWTAFTAASRLSSKNRGNVMVFDALRYSFEMLWNLSHVRDCYRILIVVQTCSDAECIFGGDKQGEGDSGSHRHEFCPLGKETPKGMRLAWSKSVEAPVADETALVTSRQPGPRLTNVDKSNMVCSVSFCPLESHWILSWHITELAKNMPAKLQTSGILYRKELVFLTRILAMQILCKPPKSDNSRAFSQPSCSQSKKARPSKALTSTWRPNAATPTLK